MTEWRVRGHEVGELKDGSGKFTAAMISGFDVDKWRVMMEAAGEVGGVPILLPRLAHLLKTLRGCGMHIGSLPELDRDFLNLP